MVHRVTENFTDEETDRVEAEGNRDESSRVVEGRLDRVHVRPGEGCRVVGLVVQSVHLERGKGEKLTAWLPVCKGTCQGRG